MEPLTIGIIATILFGGLYLWKKENAKKGEPNIFGVIALVALVATAAIWLGVGEDGEEAFATTPYQQPYTAGGAYTAGIPSDASIATHIVNGEQKVISSLSIMTIDAGSNKRTTCEDQVLYFSDTEDPRQSTAYSIDTTTIASGVGTENGSYLKTNKMYKVIFHDTSGPTYYDGVLGEGVWNPSSAIGANAIKAPTTTDATVTTSITFGEDGTAPLWKVATIPDILDETKTDGIINGQTSAIATCTTYNASSGLCEAYSASEVTVGPATGAGAGTAADDQTVHYNDTNGDGSFYLRLTFGAEGSQAYLKRPVVCFVNDMSNPCERNEFTAITASLYTGSGSEVTVPSDLHTAFSNMDSCVEIGGQSADGVAYIASGKTATYTVTFTVDHSYTDASADKFYLIPDDLGGYLAQDIRQGQGAAVTGKYLTFSFRA